MRRNEVEGVAVPTVDVSERGIAERTAFASMAWKHRLKITRRATDNLKHLRCRRLLLQRLVQFAGKPSDLRLSSAAEDWTWHACGALRRFGFAPFGVALWMVCRLLWSASSSRPP